MQTPKIMIIVIVLVIGSCTKIPKNYNHQFILAFGSCNNQDLENTLWQEVEKHKPDVWVWGGDIIYSDTNDMQVLQDNYTIQKNIPAYQHFINTTDVIGTWDDHDYGANDAGLEYQYKDASQQLFLDFMDVAPDDERRKQAGVYSVKDYKIDNHAIKIIILDTRYFRTALSADTITDKRYIANEYGEGDMLGNKQWRWLDNQLSNSQADFNVIMSSIQFLSPSHGFEKWANMPHEVKKMEDLIVSSKANNVIFLSGDRHISELSLKHLNNLKYPLIDFTASGMTHSYGKLKTEENKFRVGEIIVDKSFGILRFDFDKKQVIMEIRGENNVILQSYVRFYNNGIYK